MKFKIKGLELRRSLFRHEGQPVKSGHLKFLTICSSLAKFYLKVKTFGIIHLMWKT